MELSNQMVLKKKAGKEEVAHGTGLLLVCCSKQKGKRKKEQNKKSLDIICCNGNVHRREWGHYTTASVILCASASLKRTSLSISIFTFSSSNNLIPQVKEMLKI